QRKLKSRPDVQSTVTSLKTKAQPGTTVPHISAKTLQLFRAAGILELRAAELGAVSSAALPSLPAALPSADATPSLRESPAGSQSGSAGQYSWVSWCRVRRR